MAKTAKRLKPSGTSAWWPTTCENCQHPFGDTWESDYSMSGRVDLAMPEMPERKFSAIGLGESES
jgi:hypothetical protein